MKMYEAHLTADEIAYKRYLAGKYTYQDYLDVCNQEEAQPKPNKYNLAKEEARNKAIEWQLDVSNHNYSCSEFASWCDYFYKLGKRYGLLKEFRENGIC